MWNNIGKWAPRRNLIPTIFLAIELCRSQASCYLQYEFLAFNFISDFVYEDDVFSVSEFGKGNKSWFFFVPFNLNVRAFDTNLRFQLHVDVVNMRIYFGFCCFFCILCQFNSLVNAYGKRRWQFCACVCVCVSFPAFRVPPAFLFYHMYSFWRMDF